MLLLKLEQLNSLKYEVCGFGVCVCVYVNDKVLMSVYIAKNINEK